MKRSGAQRRGRSTILSPADLALLDRDINQVDLPTLKRRKSEASIQSTVFQLWCPTIPLRNVESSHIFGELLSSETAYLAELRSIHTTIIRPHRISKVAHSSLVASPLKASAPRVVSPKKHGRSGSLFSLRGDKDTMHISSPLKQVVPDVLKQADIEHLEKSFHGIEGLIKAHSMMMAAFSASKSPHELLSAFIDHVDALLPVYRAFVRELPYISTLLPAANDALSNKLSGYSRFLAPMQRTIKYELLFRRLLNALYTEAGSIELQQLTRIALKGAEELCQNLEASQKAEQARRYLTDLTCRLGVDVCHKILLFEGSVVTEALSSKKGCKINFAILFSDGTVFWNSTPADQERSKKSWEQETVVRVEDGGYLDVVVHTTARRPGKTKHIRRSLGFITISRPISTFSAVATATAQTAAGGHRLSGIITPVIVEVVEQNSATGEKRTRKEKVVEVWMTLGTVQEKEQRRFSLGRSSTAADAIEAYAKSPVNTPAARRTSRDDDDDDEYF